MSFEQRFAALGHRIDDLVYAVTSRRKPKIKVGPTLGERFSEGVHSAQDWVASQKDKVSADRIESMDPRKRTALVVTSAMIAGGTLVGLAFYMFGGGRAGTLNTTEVQMLQKMRGSGGTSMFATPPPAADTKPQPARPSPLTGGK